MSCEHKISLRTSGPDVVGDFAGVFEIDSLVKILDLHVPGHSVFL